MVTWQNATAAHYSYDGITWVASQALSLTASNAIWSVASRRSLPFSGSNTLSTAPGIRIVAANTTTTGYIITPAMLGSTLIITSTTTGAQHGITAPTFLGANVTNFCMFVKNGNTVASTNTIVLYYNGSIISSTGGTGVLPVGPGYSVLAWTGTAFYLYN